MKLHNKYIKTAKLLPCPFCGKEGKIYGTNLVGSLAMEYKG
jgi:hypothetical protein